jgi:hypothetical protein
MVPCREGEREREREREDMFTDILSFHSVTFDNEVIVSAHLIVRND